jgi:hypothetical protein
MGEEDTSRKRKPRTFFDEGWEDTAQRVFGVLNYRFIFYILLLLFILPLYSANPTLFGVFLWCT